ncbi:MAG: mediator of RNA polymerase II transcription subunit 8 [Claussenomyces sp. TS43310]|nr:MAG: mediator of RNA polymerase II transcription subunit 8 [Claussenomyces sp. TS43310]
MSQLRQEDLRALEQLRQRLVQLSQSIGSLKADVLRTSPMPQWDSLQNQASILASNFQSLTDHLSTHSALLNQTVAYPSTNYPGRTQENLLTHLLRKKAEPGVESWIEEGRALNGDGVHKAEELWKFASESIGRQIMETVRRILDDDYTKEEREMGVKNVRTGLMSKAKRKRNVDVGEDGEEDDEEESDEDSDEDEEMEDADGIAKTDPVQGTRTLDEMVRFATTGRVP